MHSSNPLALSPALRRLFHGEWLSSLDEGAGVARSGAASIKAAVSGDHEFGCRTDDGIPFGAAMNVGAIRPVANAVELAYQVGKQTARTQKEIEVGTMSVQSFHDNVFEALTLDAPLMVTAESAVEVIRVIDEARKKASLTQSLCGIEA